jgi:TnpA family transposase
MLRRVGGRPGRLRREVAAWRRRMRSRCRLRTMSGKTIRCGFRSLGPGSRWTSAAMSHFMTEWHQRYQGPGVMIYWHVKKKSLCVYSQLKSCSASEIAAMIEGVLRH